MIWKKILLNFGFFFILFNLSLFSSFALDINVTINESSVLTKLVSGGYSLVADGIISIKNPSLVSKIYEFNFPLNLDALIGINKIRLEPINSSQDYYDKFSFSYDKIKGYMIEPNQTIKIGYHIYGLLNYDIYNIIQSENISVLDYYVDSFDFSSNVIVNLQKAQREGYNYNNDANLTLNSTPSFSNSTRIVSAGIRNPTDFSYFIKKMKLYKTDLSDPFFNDGTLVKTFYNLSVASFSFKEVDFLDIQSSDSSVYWVSSDVIIRNNILNNFETKLIVQSNLENSGGSFGKRGGGSGGGIYFPDKNILDSILIKKDVDKTFIRNGDEFEVILKVVNINNFKIYNLTLYDIIPEGYELKDVSSNVKIKDKNLVFDISKIDEFGTFVIKYRLINKQDLKGITYLKPARLEYKNLEYFSQGIILINDILPDKKVFIQKEIDIIDKDFAKVTIKVKNLGSIVLEDLLVVDFIDENVILKDISKVFFERGSWKINLLKAGEEWEVSYIIERNSNLDTLPNIFGVEKSSVYGTLISSEEVITIFGEEPKIIEKIGLGFAVTLLVVYLLF